MEINLEELCQLRRLTIIGQFDFERFMCESNKIESESGLNPGDLLAARKFLLVTDFGDGTGCPGDLSGGSVILTASAIIPRDHPEGGRHAGG